MKKNKIIFWVVTTIAFISHAAVDQNIGFMLLPLVVPAILAVSYVYNNKIYANG